MADDYTDDPAFRDENADTGLTEDDADMMDTDTRDDM